MLKGLFVDSSVPILRVLVLLIHVNVTSVVFGLRLMTLHQDRLIARIVLCAGIGNVVLDACRRLCSVRSGWSGQ
jgi:hypothetical protein